jgi:formylglycine-generating enzyme required for sulfatase activity/predicted Ser/Thr protein kinase
MDSALSKIGKYEIVSTLGRGAMGVVYKAFDPMIGRYVALKTINTGFAHPSEKDASRRFQREAQAAGTLNHPNIVAIYDYNEEADTAFIAMEFVEGRTLGELFKQPHALTLAHIHRIMTSVLAALAYSHDKGVIHRDIKLGNIMVDMAGNIKVMDFGIARVESSELTMTGTILGTPGYMSPEQLVGEVVDQRSDLYSAGIVLYELLTGERAFTGSSFASVIYKVIHNDLSPPSRLKPALPPSLDHLIAKACAKNRENRFQNAEAFSTALDLAMTVEGGIRPPEPYSIPKKPAKRPAGETLFASPPKRIRTLWYIAGALLLAGGMTVLAIVFVPVADQDALDRAEATPGTIFKDCDTCPEMVVLPPGQFSAGQFETDVHGRIHHRPGSVITIGYPLAVGRFEITRAQFAQFARDTGFDESGCSTYDGTWQIDPDTYWAAPGFGQAPNHPVTCASWNDAQAYVAWLNEKTGQQYRLLSAAEWEYAAGAGALPESPTETGTTGACGWGNVSDRTAAEAYPGWETFDCTDGYVYTAPVGSFEANVFGIHDMVGNLFEWVADCWPSDLEQSPLDGQAPTGSDCLYRVLRGGSWFTPPEYVHTAFNNRFDPNYRSNTFGFRVARLP